MIEINSIFKVHRPGLLQNDSPATVWIPSQMGSELLVIHINILPLVRHGHCKNNMIILNQFRGFVGVCLQVDIRKSAERLFPLAKIRDGSPLVPIRCQHKESLSSPVD